MELHPLGSQVKPTGLWSGEGKCQSLYNCGLRVNKPVDISSSAETQQEAGPLLSSPGTPSQAEPSASLKYQGPPGPQCDPPAGHLLSARSRRCSQDRAQVGRGHVGHPRRTTLWEPQCLGLLLRTLGRCYLSPHQAERKKQSSEIRRACTSKCALHAQHACPECPFPCSRE